LTAAVAVTLALGVQTQVAEALVGPFVVQAADDLNVGSEFVPHAATATLTASYVSGWNMVSLPVTPDDNTFDTMFPDAISAFGFAGGYQQVDTLDPCDGYWLNLTDGGEYTLTGTAVDPCDLDLPSSWSMVGVPYGGTEVFDGIADGDNLVSIFGFSGGYVQKVEGDVLEEAQGFWFNMSDAGAVELQGAAESSAKRISGLPGAASLSNSKLTIANQGIEQVVFLGVAADAMTALPPSAPAGALDLRVEVAGVAMNSVPHADDVMEYPLRVSGSQRLHWDIDADAGRQWDLVVNGQTHALTGRGSLTLSDFSNLSLRYSPVPDKFALAANYPNPFNPSTTIGYGLAEASQVKLTVYDVLGQKVHDLVNKQQSAGTYQVTWDGRNGHGQQVASGMYFYALQAGDFRSMHKMLLSK